MAPGMSERAMRDASSMTCSPALSQITTSSGVVTSGVEYSGWAWSTYSRAPLVRMTLARPRSSSVSWLGSASCAAQVEAARVAQRGLLLEVPARPAGLDRGAGVGVDDLGARPPSGWRCGCPGTEMPYSVSVPMTRRTVTGRAYAHGEGTCQAGRSPDHPPRAAHRSRSSAQGAASLCRSDLGSAGMKRFPERPSTFTGVT